MPEVVPTLDPLFFRQLPALSLPEIGLAVVTPWVGDEIPKKDLKRLLEDAFDFPIPLKFLEAGTGVLELFHGPSFAFKDVGARFMSRVMGYFIQSGSRELDILVATSGDTGGAVALGFLDVPGIRVTILYPEGKVSPVQEWQLTGHGKNIRAIAIKGDFDDCQSLVKNAFRDPELQHELRLTSANSINISRLLPQSLYYFWAYAQLMTQGIREVAFTVPSGNFGNIGAGLLAERMGLPVQALVAATNANDTVPRFLRGSEWEVRTTEPTLSNAMDVSNPSNWIRIMELFGRDSKRVRSHLTAYSYSDEETRNGINLLMEMHGYLACPHTAIGWLAAKEHQQKRPGTYASVFLSTAHPCKFPEVYPESWQRKIPEPATIQGWQNKPTWVRTMDSDFTALKDYLLS